MTARTKGKLNLIKRALRPFWVAALWLTKPAASMTAPQEQRRVRILAAFLLLMAINTLSASAAIVDPTGHARWVMMTASAIFLLGYIISRTRYYKAAIVLGLIIPAVPSLALALYGPPDIDPLAELMWLALPLLISSLLLSLRKVVIISASYFLFAIILRQLGYLGAEVVIPLLAYLASITLFVLAIAAARRHDQSEIETQLRELKEKDAALADEAVRRRILVEQSSDGIVVLDQNGKVYEANQRFADMLGYSMEEARQLCVWDWEFLYPREKVVEMMRTVDENGDHFETQHRRKDGTIYDVEISTNGAEFAGQKLIFCVCRDITERKRAEEALRESEEKFSKAFHGSPESISISTLKDGRFIEVNDGFIRDKGYSRKEIIGHTSTELGLFINPDERDNITKTLKQKGRVKNLQVEYRTKSGALRTGLLSAEIITLNDEPCVILMNNDITERRRVEDALRESEEKFSRAFHGSPDSMTISTLGDGTFIEANDSYTRLTGYSREELLGHNATEFNMWADDEQRERIIRNIRQQTKMHNEEFLLRTKSGEILTLLFSTEYVHIGGELNLLSVCTDITERKRAEEELRKTGARLEATNQELEAFSYSVSHDLRSPLRSIDGFSQALLEDYTEKLDESGQDYLKRLRNASQKMGELIDGTLKLSRLTRGEMQYEEVNLSELAQEITTRLQEGQPERKVKFVIAKDLTARGDVQMLRAMLENLLGNAWKFTGKSPRARIEFGLSRNGDKPAFFIKDNGAGFDAAYADKLFNAFQRLHSEAEFPGTGIGLATVRRIINRHGGTIRAEGEAGKGATFYFTLE